MKTSKFVFLFIVLFLSSFSNYIFAQSDSEGMTLERLNLILKNHYNYSAETQRRTNEYIVSKGYHKDSLYQYVLNFDRKKYFIEITETSPKNGVFTEFSAGWYTSKYPEQQMIKKDILPLLKKAEEQYKKKATFGFILAQKGGTVLLSVYVFCD
jgi:hypothetical protein